MIPDAAGSTTIPTCGASRATSLVVSCSARPTEMSGTSHSHGLRYVMRSSTATTPAVARSSVVSAPSKTWVRSVMMAGPPVTCARRPAGRSAAAVVRTLPTSAGTASALLVSSGTAITATEPSVEYCGGATCPPTARGARAAARALIAVLSAAFSPDGKSILTGSGARKRLLAQLGLGRLIARGQTRGHQLGDRSGLRQSEDHSGEHDHGAQHEQGSTSAGDMSGRKAHDDSSGGPPGPVRAGMS